MNLSASSFIKLLDEQGIKYSVDERENDTVVTVSFQMKNTAARVAVFMDNDNAHVALRCFSFVKIPEEKFANGLIACNQFNQEYRWVKFVLDSDHNVTVMDDAVVSPDTAGKEIHELMFRMFNIADDCYPKLMKGIWA